MRPPWKTAALLRARLVGTRICHMSPVSHLRARAHARAHLHTDIRVRACVWGTKTGGGGRMNRRTQHGPGPAPRSQTPDPASPERDARRISGRGRRVARPGVAATPRAGLSAEAEPATASPTRARGPLGAETAPGREVPQDLGRHEGVSPACGIAPTRTHGWRVSAARKTLSAEGNDGAPGRPGSRSAGNIQGNGTNLN